MGVSLPILNTFEVVLYIENDIDYTHPIHSPNIWPIPDPYPTWSKKIAHQLFWNLLTKTETPSLPNIFVALQNKQIVQDTNMVYCEDCTTWQCDIHGSFCSDLGDVIVTWLKRRISSDVALNVLPSDQTVPYEVGAGTPPAEYVQVRKNFTRKSWWLFLYWMSCCSDSATRRVSRIFHRFLQHQQLVGLERSLPTCG